VAGVITSARAIVNRTRKLSIGLKASAWAAPSAAAAGVHPSAAAAAAVHPSAAARSEKAGRRLREARSATAYPSA
jgi:hypothetical protein